MKTETRPDDLRPAPRAVMRLPEALQILATRMRAAVAKRRSAPPGSDRYRRADEEVAHLNELYVRLQRRMEIPTEIWLLGGGHFFVRWQDRPGWRSPRREPSSSLAGERDIGLFDVGA